MRESQYTSNVNKGFPESVYVVKLSLRFTSGVPDCWYSGPGGDLWVEFKWYRKMPHTLNLTVGKAPKLSRLQQHWLRSRHQEGRNVAVVVGSPEGSVILTDLEWTGPVVSNNRLVSKQQVVAWISSIVCANGIETAVNGD